MTQIPWQSCVVWNAPRMGNCPPVWRRAPIPEKELTRRFREDVYRTQRRFGVAQGFDSDGSPKIRAIDNSAGNLMNACTRTYVKIAPPSFAFTAPVARSFRSARADTSDMARAYRSIPVRDTHFTVFAH